MVVEQPLRLFVLEIQSCNHFGVQSAVYTKVVEEIEGDGIVGVRERREVEEVVVEAQQSLMLLLSLQEILGEAAENSRVG